MMTVDAPDPRGPTGSQSVSLRPTRSSSVVRPGRIHSASPQDVAHSQAFGDDVYHKDAQITRIFYQNVKGLTYSSSGEDFKYCLDSLQSLQTDIAGLSETNLPWLQAPYLQADSRQCLRQQFHTGKVVFSSPSSEADPVEISDNFQAGDL